MTYNGGAGGSTLPFATVIVRENIIRYYPTGMVGTNPPRATFVYAATNALVRENVIDVDPTLATPMMDRYCTTMQYFENRTSAGALMQGVRATGVNTYDQIYTELATDADDAFILNVLLS